MEKIISRDIQDGIQDGYRKLNIADCMAGKTEIPSAKHTFFLVKKCNRNKANYNMLPYYKICRDIQDDVPDSCRKQKIKYLRPKISQIMFECVKFVITLPHIYTMKTLIDLLQWSDWVSAIVQADIVTPRTADSFLRAALLTCARRTHQITAVAPFILQRQAYERWCHMHETDVLDRDFEDWCHLRKHASLSSSTEQQCWNLSCCYMSTFILCGRLHSQCNSTP